MSRDHGRTSDGLSETRFRCGVSRRGGRWALRRIVIRKGSGSATRDITSGATACRSPMAMMSGEYREGRIFHDREKSSDVKTVL